MNDKILIKIIAAVKIWRVKVETGACYTYETPYGIISIKSDGSAITSIKIAGEAEPVDRNIADKLTDKAAKQLNEYFASKRKQFDLPLKPHGTNFQLAVWKALVEIPYGETRSYKDIAVAINNPKACRAVGLANNKNPVWIVIPCHRVIGSNGTLTGYGGGLKMKQRLLDLEKNRNRKESKKNK